MGRTGKKKMFSKSPGRVLGGGGGRKRGRGDKSPFSGGGRDADTDHADRKRFRRGDTRVRDDNNDDPDASDSDSSGSLDPADTISLPKTLRELEGQRRVIVVLERSSLEIVKKGEDYQLLNCDDHSHIMRKHGRDPASARPDITHQSLLALLDSPLNKRGLLSVFIRTEKDVLIEVNPQTRIPRTFRRFSGLMVQLLHKLSIRAADGSAKLLKVVKNPVTRHLPASARKIGTSCKADVVRLRKWVKTLPQNEPIVFVFGAMSHGIVTPDYVDEMVSFSEYPLSAACAIGKLLGALEDMWDIV